MDLGSFVEVAEEEDFFVLSWELELLLLLLLLEFAALMLLDCLPGAAAAASSALAAKEEEEGDPYAYRLQERTITTVARRRSSRNEASVSERRSFLYS